MLKNVGIAAAILFATASALTHAHEGHQHVMGTVTALDAKHLEVNTPEARSVPILLTKETKNFRNRNPVKDPKIAIGTRVVVDLGGETDRLTATEGRIGPVPDGSSGIKS